MWSVSAVMPVTLLSGKNMRGNPFADVRSALWAR
jgi:hypothetical protein